jgi:predicted PurR-regulated permease PerM
VNPPAVPPAGPSAPLVRAEGPLATGERFRPLALAALTVALIGLCVWLAVPFLPAVTWAVALAILAWPLHAWVCRRVPRAGLAAGVSTLLVVLVVVLPGAFVSYQLAREAANAAEQMKDRQAEGAVRDTLARAPGMAGVVGWMDRAGVDVDREVRGAIASYTRDVASLVQGSLNAALQAVICLFILFHLFRDRAELAGGVRRLLPMTRAEAERVFRLAADSVHANLYADLVTSLIDAATGGLVFWAVGLPSPLLWAVVMFVLSLLPVVGIPVVWVPAAIYLGTSGHMLGAAVVVVWGIAAGVLVDNLLYARIAGDRMRLHQVPTLIAFLGGLAVFGASGMVLGPAILAVTVAVLDVWHRRANGLAVEVVTEGTDPRAAPAEEHTPRPVVVPGVA